MPVTYQTCHTKERHCNRHICKTRLYKKFQYMNPVSKLCTCPLPASISTNRELTLDCNNYEITRKSTTFPSLIEVEVFHTRHNVHMVGHRRKLIGTTCVEAICPTKHKYLWPAPLVHPPQTTQLPWAFICLNTVAVVDI